MFGAYRLDLYADPDSFMLQIAALFTQYEDTVLLRATDPFNPDNIQRTHKFPPSIQEVAAALDATVRAIETEAMIAERESRGFRLTSCGFFNAEGVRYDPRKHHALPQLPARIGGGAQ